MKLNHTVIQGATKVTQNQPAATKPATRPAPAQKRVMRNDGRRGCARCGKRN